MLMYFYLKETYRILLCILWSLLFLIHKCSRQFRQSDWTKHNHVGCINGWYRLAYQIRTEHMCQLFASCFVRRVTRISTNQSDADWHHAPDSCTLEVFCVSPKREFAHFCPFAHLALLNKNYIKNPKSIRAFINASNSFTLGFYRGLTTGFVRGHKRQGPRIRSYVARGHAQNRSLTCGKDRPTNCYSLSLIFIPFVFLSRIHRHRHQTQLGVVASNPCSDHFIPVPKDLERGRPNNHSLCSRWWPTGVLGEVLQGMQSTKSCANRPRW